MIATLRLTAFVPPWPFVIAERLGFHRAEGIDVVTSPTTSSPEQLRRLLDEEVDLAVTAIDNLFVWNRDGADIGAAAVVEETTPLRVVARPGLNDLGQLRDAQLGVDAPANGFVIALRHLLADAGVRDYRMIEAGGVRSRFDALLAGDIDATLLGPPFDQLALQAGMVQLADVIEQWPRFPGQGLVVRRDRLGELGPSLDALLRAWRTAIDWARSAEDESLAEVAGEGAPPAAALRAALPAQLEPELDRLRILSRMREALGMLPEGGDVRDLLV